MKRIFIDLNDNDALYVADYENERVLKFEQGQTNGEEEGDLFRPSALFVDSNRSLGGRSQLNGPMAVVVDHNENIYITDRGSHRIVKWMVAENDGDCIIGCTGDSGTAADQLNEPTDLKFDSFAIRFVQMQDDDDTTTVLPTTTTDDVSTTLLTRLTSPSDVGNGTARNGTAYFIDLNSSNKQRVIITLAVLCVALAVLLGFLVSIVVCQWLQRGQIVQTNGDLGPRYTYPTNDQNYRQTAKL
ncbi:unnamed protein product [Didymodactylos carnosus]|uniref:Uncharacterized protein n=1 Tax=Didymodactylos carnosus TaxID=1234261 RepID=A0A814ZJ58_9BILA|nr:unnamed protein product [Didymodactylos carnosus]CAF4008786.1 unnamed protein product [Didymodactylos carnosus]